MGDCVEVPAPAASRDEPAKQTSWADEAIDEMSTGVDVLTLRRGDRFDAAGLVRLAAALKLNMTVTSVDLWCKCAVCVTRVRVRFMCNDGSVTANKIGRR